MRAENNEDQASISQILSWLGGGVSGMYLEANLVIPFSRASMRNKIASMQCSKLNLSRYRELMRERSHQEPLDKHRTCFLAITGRARLVPNKYTFS